MSKVIRVVEVLPSEFGLTKEMAEPITSALPQVIEDRKPLTAEFAAVMKMDMDDPQTVEISKDLRKRIKDHRTKVIKPWFTVNKDVFKRGGQFVDALNRREKKLNEDMEAKLQEIEDYEAKKIEDAKDKIRVLRNKKVEKYREFIPMHIDLGELTEKEFENSINGAKLLLKAQEKEQAKQEKINEAIKITRARKDKLMIFWNFVEDQNQDISKLTEKKFEALLKEAKKGYEKDRAEKAKALEAQAKLNKIESDKQQAAAEKAKELEKLAKAPVKKQILAWINSFQFPEAPLAHMVVTEIEIEVGFMMERCKEKIEKM